jgi:hypothetical protein
MKLFGWAGQNLGRKFATQFFGASLDKSMN